MRARTLIVAAALAAAACSSGPTAVQGPPTAYRAEDPKTETALNSRGKLPDLRGLNVRGPAPLPGPGTGGGGTFGSGTAAFHNYEAPPSVGSFVNQAGETSIGNNPKTNATMFLMTLDTVKVTWDGSAVPVSEWTNVSVPRTQRTTLDPILWTDRITGRTYVLQLIAAGSQLAYTDNDGATWQDTLPPTNLTSFDHPSIGGGPYASFNPPAGPLTDYPHNLYYCSQFAVSHCARSDTGGLTWGPPVLMSGGCSGLHGDPVVSAQGHVYVPFGRCANGSQGMQVSVTNGMTWVTRPVPIPRPTTDGIHDPGVAFDAAGKMYFVGSSGTAWATTSTDGGSSWSDPVDVGAPFGIRNAVFPMAIAGDAGRAAVAFYGTTTAGNTQSDTFAGDWHLYVALTYDGGATWETVQVTPDGDPVQRGCIWLGGGLVPCRNLLDFQGMTIDANGRVLVGYADGCRFPCNLASGTPSQSRSSYGVIARQTVGKGLLAQFDN